MSTNYGYGRLRELRSRMDAAAVTADAARDDGTGALLEAEDRCNDLARKVGDDVREVGSLAAWYRDEPRRRRAQSALAAARAELDAEREALGTERADRKLGEVRLARGFRAGRD
jgi:hypothetical protein